MQTMKTKVLPWMRAAVLMGTAFGLAGVALHAQQDTPPPPSTQQQDQQQGPPADQLGGPGPGHGMGPRGRGMDSERQEHMLIRHLNLTPDQVTKLKAIDADNMQQMQALHNDSSLSQADMHSRMQALHADRETKIAGILTDEQKQKYADMQAKMRERRMEHGAVGNGEAAPPPPPPPSQQ